MQFDVLTLFPEMIDSYCNCSILKRATSANVISVNSVNPRDFTLDKHKKVDDTPYGGGAGMVLMAQPYVDAYESIEKLENYCTIMMTPQGQPFDNDVAKELATFNQVVILCGHYEGYDERIREIIKPREISIGDFVLTGGEYPSMCMMDAIIRLIPGVINKESLDSESFTNNTLDYPMYTKPYEYEGMKVPDVLISGNHQKIDEWRKEMAMKKTLEKRPDLMEDSNE